MDARTLRSLLEREHGRILELVRQVRQTAVLVAVSAEPGDNSEVGSRTLEREFAESMESSLERELAAVEDAIRQVDRGAFGNCHVCGKRISDRRLRARPTADTCVSHAARRV